MAKKKLGEILIAEGLLEPDGLANALAEQRKWGGRLGSLLIRMGLVSEEELAGVLERQLNIRCVALHDREIDRAALALVPVDLAKQNTVFPVRLLGKTLTLAMVDPLDIPTIDDLQFRLDIRIVPALALESEIMRAIAVHYEGAMVEQFTPPRPVKTAGRPAESGHAAPEGEVEFEPEPEPSGISPKQKEPPSEAPTHREVLEALVHLLIDKGIIQREDLVARLKDVR